MERGIEVPSGSGVRTGCVGRGQAQGFPGAGHGEAGRSTKAPGARREADRRAAARRVVSGYLICGLPSWHRGEGCSCQHGRRGDTAGPPGREDPPEEEMAACTEGPGGLQSLGRRARHD